MEKIGSSGDGLGNGGKSGGNHRDDSHDSYTRWKKDMERAEEYYGRAILASPGDGEVLSLYAKLIWERYRDKNRAKSYFDRAITASPDDCVVLGSYARFMWEAEVDEEEGEMGAKVGVSPAMVAAF